jgi:hypothetical protein
MKTQTEIYEKHRLENIRMTEDIQRSLEDLDSVAKTLTEKMENSVTEVTGINYTILQPPG